MVEWNDTISKLKIKESRYGSVMRESANSLFFVFTFTFTFINLADAFIQSNFQERALQSA